MCTIKVRLVHLYTITQDRKEQLVHTGTVRPRHQRSVSIHTLRQSHGQEAGSILHSCIATKYYFTANINYLFSR